jgi:hypothetical protein
MTIFNSKRAILSVAENHMTTPTFNQVLCFSKSVKFFQPLMPPQSPLGKGEGEIHDWSQMLAIFASVAVLSAEFFPSMNDREPCIRCTTELCLGRKRDGIYRRIQEGPDAYCATLYSFPTLI